MASYIYKSMLFNPLKTKWFLKWFRHLPIPEKSIVLA